MFAAWSVLLCACSGPAPESDPRAVLAAYLDAVIAGRHEDASRHVLADAGEGRRIKQEADGSFEEKLVRRGLAAHVSFEILSVEIKGARVRAEVKISSPDFRLVSREICRRLGAAEFPVGGIDSLEYAVEAVMGLVGQYRVRGIPAVSEKRKFELVNEGGAWKIIAPRGELLPEGPVIG